ncbi:predicted protein [Chaetomium globosum CBS 148.51]|uniref:Uncharacterized protein n=1 Tax=Chaetomium globosum (strain ATCC 6205 / CBS 148.51 / DSM 1962 / NBRC 6347 / NRRL 1970) TaxID=306901 RepID=Q2HGP1_CHAGB|nr:uncharacterized protein CHGG_00613 [Chaetomium globosum CBS 148.51]EAQ92378.1 predicted protein [Chaetomium globosum CBS 148.51]
MALVTTILSPRHPLVHWRHRTCLNPISAGFPNFLTATTPFPLLPAPSRLYQQTHLSRREGVASVSPTVDEVPEQTGRTEQEVSMAEQAPPSQRVAVYRRASKSGGVGTATSSASEPPTVPAAILATPTTVSPFPTGMTAVAELLETQGAVLAAASQSVQGVASMVNKAFLNLMEEGEGLREQKALRENWPAIALNASKESAAMVDWFFADIQYIDNVLVRASRVAGSVADQGSGKTHESKFMSVFWGSGLRQHRKNYRRQLDSLSRLIEDSDRPHATFRQDAENFRVKQLNLLEIMVNLDDFDNENLVLVIGPGKFFHQTPEQECVRLSTRRVPRPSARLLGSRGGFVCPRPPYGRGAGTMLDDAFLNGIEELSKLLAAMEMERIWIEGTLKKWLGPLSRGSGWPMAELQVLAKEMVVKAGEWRMKLRELYYE